MIFADVKKILVLLEKIQADITAQGIRLDATAKGVVAIYAEITGKAAEDLNIVFGPLLPILKGNVHMANNKKAHGPGVKCPCLAPKGGKKATMPDVLLTDPLPASVTIQPLDASGNPIALTAADIVTCTLTSDSGSLVISDGADATHFVATIPANTPQGSVANLAATLDGTIQGAPAHLTASVKVTINVPPNPVAVDMAIIFG